MTTSLNRRQFLATTLTAPAIAALSRYAHAADAPTKRMNVLFIASDDLRPQLGCYGDAQVKTPNIDRLASTGLLFDRCYCQQGLCSPSRISLLSGRQPATTKIFDIGPTLRSTMPDIVTLPQHFKNNGYFTRSLGKIYHIGIDDPASWSVPSFVSRTPRYGPIGQAAIAKRRQEMLAAGQTIPEKGANLPTYAGPAFESVDCADEELTDGDTCREAIEALRGFAKNPGQPFFLGCGFVNPHVPYVAPKKYFGLYNVDQIKLPDNRFAPKDAPKFAAQTGADFFWYAGTPKDRKVSEQQGREYLHAYMAAISYVDAQVGKLLKTLEETGLAKNTIVVFWGDNGYYMGEHDWWGGKHNNYEGATRTPLIISVPGQRPPASRTNALTEFTDIYPSLVDICGLPPATGLEGVSFKPLLTDPSRSWRTAAFSWYPKGGNLGTTMRTDRYRYVEWIDKKGALAATELYDHQTDPQENQNLADRSENAPLIAKLHAQLQAGWKGAIPRP